MYIFLDESGDLGFENKNSSPLFCITRLVCYNKDSLQSFKSAIKRTLHAKFNQKKTKNIISELKGSKTTLDVKQFFYKQLSKFSAQDWEIYSIIFDKKSVFNQTKIQYNPHELYNLLSQEIIKRVDFSFLHENIQLIVDKCKGKHERGLFDFFLKTSLESKLPMNVSLNITHEVLHRNAGLQAVDLFCYGIVRKHTKDDIDWYSEFSDKITEEVYWEYRLKQK